MPFSLFGRSHVTAAGRSGWGWIWLGGAGGEGGSGEGENDELHGSDIFLMDLRYVRCRDDEILPATVANLCKSIREVMQSEMINLS